MTQRKQKTHRKRTSRRSRSRKARTRKQRGGRNAPQYVPPVLAGNNVPNNGFNNGSNNGSNNQTINTAQENEYEGVDLVHLADHLLGQIRHTLNNNEQFQTILAFLDDKIYELVVDGDTSAFRDDDLEDLELHGDIREKIKEVVDVLKHMSPEEQDDFKALSMEIGLSANQENGQEGGRRSYTGNW